MTQTIPETSADTLVEPAPPTQAEVETAGSISRRLRVGLLVSGWSLADELGELLRRIPRALRDEFHAIYVIPSGDDLAPSVLDPLRDEFPALRLLLTRFGGGEGRRQKLAMRCAIRGGCELLVTLRTDAGHAPEYLARLIAAFDSADVALVIASRLGANAATVSLPRRWCLKATAGLQNRLLGTSLADPHSRYRAYRAATLDTLPFENNSDNAVFETELIIQHGLAEHRIDEVDVPSTQVSGRPRGVIYAIRSFRTVLRALANRLHLVYHPKFDLEGAKPAYRFKVAPGSLHQWVIHRHSVKGAKIADVGAGSAGVSETLHDAGADVVAIDHRRPDRELPFRYVEADLDQDFASIVVDSLKGQADKMLALDVIEHLKRPEHGMAELHRALRPGGTLIAKYANVAYFMMRASLILGLFNYGKRGILDVTHTRLFTIRSFLRALEGEGFRIDRVRGFGPPIRDVIGDTFVLRFLDRVASGLARVWPSMFSYQFLVEATRLDDAPDLDERDRPAEAGGTDEAGS